MTRFLVFAKENEVREILSKPDNIYEKRSLAPQLALRKQLLSLKLQGDNTLFQHFIRFNVIIADLVAAGAVLEEIDKVSSSYDGVITALETLGPDNLNLTVVKTRLLDHEVELQTREIATNLKALRTSSSYPP